MSHFITKQEVVNIAFSESNINKGFIDDNTIMLAEESHIRPVLGDDFYTRLNQTSPTEVFTAYETEVKNRIKLALAFYVKYEILPKLSLRVDNSGINILNTHNANMGGVQERREVQTQVKRQADLWSDHITRYLAENKENLTYYKSGEGVIRRRSSIIF